MNSGSRCFETPICLRVLNFFLTTQSVYSQKLPKAVSNGMACLNKGFHLELVLQHSKSKIQLHHWKALKE